MDFLLPIFLIVLTILLVGLWIFNTRRSKSISWPRQVPNLQEEPLLTAQNKRLEDTKRAMLNILEDLNHEKKLLEEDKAEDEALLGSIGDGVIAVDPEKNIVFMNKAAQELLELTTTEVVSKYYAQFWDVFNEKGESVPDDQRPLVSVLKRHISVHTTSYSYQTRSGRQFPVSLTITPVLLDEELKGAIVVFRDITREKEVDRMKTEFISLASHQLRSPLSTKRLLLKMLLTGQAGNLAPEQKQYIEMINQSNDHMLELVTALLDITRIESGRIIVEPVATDVGKLIQEIQLDLKAKLEEKKQQISLHIERNVPKIELDPKLIRQVYLNLLENASKYTPQGGKISVSLSKKDAMLVSEVKDTGYGIPQKEQEKVFTKFYRGINIVKESPEGTGLGLYLVKAIVESSKGRIWFKSEEGKGTAFYFTLPLRGISEKKGEVGDVYDLTVK